MADFKDDFLSWAGRGFALATGAAAFCALLAFATIGTAVGIGWLALGDIRPSATEPTALHAAPQRERVRRYIQPQNKATCLERSNGVANERYARCREGYWVTRYE